MIELDSSLCPTSRSYAAHTRSQMPPPHIWRWGSGGGGHAGFLRHPQCSAAVSLSKMAEPQRLRRCCFIYLTLCLGESSVVFFHPSLFHLDVNVLCGFVVVFIKVKLK